MQLEVFVIVYRKDARIDIWAIDQSLINSRNRFMLSATIVVKRDIFRRIVGLWKKDNENICKGKEIEEIVMTSSEASKKVSGEPLK